MAHAMRFALAPLPRTDLLPTETDDSLSQMRHERTTRLATVGVSLQTLS
jgi:hypothetical protein